MTNDIVELKTIQKRGKLNKVFVTGSPHPVNAGYHNYVIELSNTNLPVIHINFQNGPRNEKESIPGVLDADLLEIVLHRLQSFQQGPYATRENALAITKLEEALLWLNKRAEDRIENNKLGTSKV